MKAQWAVQREIYFNYILFCRFIKESSGNVLNPENYLKHKYNS